MTVAVAGLTLTALAEAVTGRGLLFGRFAQVPSGWELGVTLACSEVDICSLS